MLKVQSTPANWKPEGLAVISKDTLAVIEGSTVTLVCMETSYNAGHLVKVVDNLEAPHGLCPSRTEGTVFVADGYSIKENSVRISCNGFQQAFDVALSLSGNLGVTYIKEQNGTCTYNVKITIGNGIFGYSDGLVAKAQLSEPTGLCFDFDSAIFCCFGGSKNGYIKIHTPVEFACTFMSKVREIYHAIGFLPKKRPESTSSDWSETCLPNC